MAEWISVKDRLPTENGKYLAAIAGDKIEEPYVILWWFYNGKFQDFYYFPTRYVSHWMPLPEPPKEEDND